MKKLPLLALLALMASSVFAADSSVPAGQLPVADHLVFLGELPASEELMKNAAASGLTVTRIDRTSDRVVISYSFPNGQTATMGYALLSSVGNRDWVAPKPVKAVRRPEIVTVVRPEPEIIYYEPSYRTTRYVYRDPVDSFWMPWSFGAGFGWVAGHNHRSFNHHHWNHWNRGNYGTPGRNHGRGPGRGGWRR